MRTSSGDLDKLRHLKKLTIKTITLLSSCKASTILLVCTKTDSPENKFDKRTEKTILKNCRTLITKIEDYKNSSLQVNSVSLLSEILYTSSAHLPAQGDPRKSPKELQNIIAAVNRFTAKTVIPNNWNDFGINIFF